MKNRIQNRLRARSGETLVETLVSTLVVGLATTLLCSMMSAAKQVDKAAEQRDERFYGELKKAETGVSYTLSGLSTPSVVLKGGGSDITVNITLCGSEDGLTSYRKE